MAEKKSFVLYYDAVQQWNMLSNEQAGILIKGILQYCITGQKLETNDGMIAMAYSFITAQIDRDMGKWEETCKRNSENGKKGGRPKKQTETEKTDRFFEKPLKAKKADTDTDTETDTETDTVTENETETDISPSDALRPTRPLSQKEVYNKLVEDYGTDNVEEYIRKVRNWCLMKDRNVTDLYGTVRKWLEKDGVQKPDFDTHKYDFVINAF